MTKWIYYIGILVLYFTLVFQSGCSNPLGSSGHVDESFSSDGSSGSGGSETTPDTSAPTDPSGLTISGNASETQARLLTWIASTDDVGVSFYEVALGTTGTGAGVNDLVDWLSVGAVTSYQLVNGVDSVTLSLTSNTSYFISVRATDAAGNVSGVATSSAFSFFRPGDLSDLVLWLDAQDTTRNFQLSGCTTAATSDSDPLLCWQDATANSHNVIMNAGTPQLFTSIINSLPAIEFADSERSEIANSALINTAAFSARTHYIVFRTDADVATRQLLFKEGGGTNGTGFYVEGGFLWIGVWINGAAQRAWQSFAVSGDSNYIAGFVFDAASNSFTASANGTATSTTGLGAAQDLLSHSGNINLGAGDTSIRLQDASSATVTNTVSYHGEHLMYNTVPTTGEREQIEGYLACEWSMQGDLPGGHTYKTDCP